MPFLKGNELPARQITQFFQLILSNPKICCIFAFDFILIVIVMTKIIIHYRPNYLDEFTKILELKFNEQYYSKNKKLTINEILDECQITAVQICCRVKFELGGILPDEEFSRFVKQMYEASTLLFPDLKKKKSLDKFREFIYDSIESEYPKIRGFKGLILI